MFNTLRWGLQKMDIFGQIVFLRMNRQPYYRTKVGGLISLAVLFAVIYFFSQNLQSFFSKEELKVVSVNEYEDTVQQLELDASDFMFAFKIDQDNFTTQPYFRVTLEQWIYQRLTDGSQTKTSAQIPLIPCTLSRFQEIFYRYDINFENQYDILGLSDFLCPQKNAIFNLGGTYTSSDFQFVTLSVQQCLNSSEVSCASQEAMASYYKDAGAFKLQIYTVNQIVNPYKQGYRTAFLDDQIYFTFAPHQLNRQANIYLKKYEFINDESLMPLRQQFEYFSDIKQDTLFLIDQSDIKEMSDIGSSKDIIFATFNFRLNPFKTKFTRSYQKIDELLSNLGGIQQVLFFFIGLFVGFYDRLQCTVFLYLVLIELANKLYEFSIDSTLKLRQHQDNLELIDQFMQHRDNIIHNSDEKLEMEEMEPDCKLSQDVSQRYNLLNLFVNTGALQQQQQQQSKGTIPSKSTRETIKQQFIISEKLKCISGLDYFQNQINNIIERQRPIHLTFQIFCNYFSFGKLFKDEPAVKIMNKAFDNIIDKIDIHHILLKLNELEKLKETVLTYKQLLMFNFTPKPQIHLDSMTQEPSRQMLEQKVKGLNSNQSTLQLFSLTILEMIAKIKPQSIMKNSVAINLIQQEIISFTPKYLIIQQAYDDILQQSDAQWTNKALITKLGPELQVVFKLSKLIDSQHKIYKKKRHPTRRGALQQEEEDLCVKMFDNQSVQS